jgi:peptidoglycan hydrolase-like protein with peptidoglycan-binding domain
MPVMYDGVNPDTVPAGAQVYAGYVNGNWPTYNAFVAKFPAAQHVTISVFSAGDAQVLDVEQGDAAAVDVPAWLNRQRARGQHRPTIYCSRVGAPGYGWQDVINACNSAGVALPDFWIADYTSGPHSLTLGSVTAVAVQWTDHGGYDESVINDPSWPGNTSPGPVPPTPSEENMNTLSNTAPWNNSKHGDTMTAQICLRKKFGQTQVVVDGIYGQATAHAIKNVQKFFGLGVDGICGQQTWSILLHLPLPA